MSLKFYQHTSDNSTVIYQFAVFSGFLQVTNPGMQMIMRSPAGDSLRRGAASGGVIHQIWCRARYGSASGGDGLRRVTFLLVQKSNQKTRQGEGFRFPSPWTPTLKRLRKGGCGPPCRVNPPETGDAGRWTVDGGWWTVGGGRWTADGGRRTGDGGRWTGNGGWYMTCVRSQRG